MINIEETLTSSLCVAVVETYAFRGGADLLTILHKK